MNEERISAFLLERYHIGEVTPEEKIKVEKALGADESLAQSLENLFHADENFYKQFPAQKFFPENKRSMFDNPTRRRNGHFGFRRVKKVPPLVWGFCAAVMVFAVVIPLFVLRNPAQAEFDDRMKGSSANGSSIELSVYARGNSAGEGIMLADQTGVSEGNIIQLVYRVTGDKHGVIFSIYGRSCVTLHYPYNARQNTRLISGRNVPLDEAFTLDDAPDYEIFFFVANDTPMSVRNILNTAEQLALLVERNPSDAERLGMAAFEDFEVKVFTLIKK